MKKKIIYIIGILIVWTGIIFGILFFHSTEDRSQSLDITSDFVQDLYQTAVPNENEYILNQLYNHDTFTNEYKLSTSIMALLKKMNIEDVSDISLNATDIENIAKEIFGQDVKLKHQKLMFMFQNACGFEYDEQKRQYHSFSGCGGIQVEYFYRKLIKAEENKNKIILTERIVYSYTDLVLERTDTFIYNNSRQDKMLDFKQINLSEFDKDELASYIDSGSTYELIFEKENDHYIFKQCILKK